MSDRCTFIHNKRKWLAEDVYMEIIKNSSHIDEHYIKMAMKIIDEKHYIV